jgi:hypothetical protein
MRADRSTEVWYELPRLCQKSGEGVAMVDENSMTARAELPKMLSFGHFTVPWCCGFNDAACGHRATPQEVSMRRREPENVPILGVVEVKLPDFLFMALEAFARRDVVSVDQAAAFVIDHLPGLTRQDISELRETPKEKISRVCQWRVGWTRKRILESFSSECGYSYSEVLRRGLHAFLISREIVIINFKFQRTQLRFNFSENCERNKTDSLASRQHWEAL